MQEPNPDAPAPLSVLFRRVLPRYHSDNLALGLAGIHFHEFSERKLMLIPEEHSRKETKTAQMPFNFFLSY
jgi:hypothetical protein